MRFPRLLRANESSKSELDISSSNSSDRLASRLVFAIDLSKKMTKMAQEIASRGSC